MLTVVAVLLALLLVPPPWGWILVIVAAAADTVETAVFLWWSKRRRSVVGLDALVGQHAVVVTVLAPRGQVRVHGEIWEALSPVPVEPGLGVVVRSVDGLLLEVEPTA